MREIEGLNVDHELHVAGSDILCIFLPSGRAPNAISTYPRLGWKKRLSGLDILYLADPYQNVEEFKAIGGSWFISREGDSILPVFAEVLNRFIAKSGYRRTILYGSSMGGYAAIILGCWIDNSHAIAECPQIFLDKYPVSNGVITRFCSPEQREKLPNAVSILLENANSSRFTIAVNAFDQHHVNEHILPLMNLLTARETPVKSRINFLFYINEIYPRGHTALMIEDAIHLIRQAQDLEDISEAIQLRSQLANVTSRLNEIESSRLMKFRHQIYRLTQTRLVQAIFRLFLKRKKQV
jgi:hypothetical protein